jgi:sulfur carrier protein
VKVTINGKPTEVGREATVADVVASVGAEGASTGVAVARNGEVVNRARWSATSLSDGDLVEILGAMQGG